MFISSVYTSRLILELFCLYYPSDSKPWCCKRVFLSNSDCQNITSKRFTLSQFASRGEYGQTKIKIDLPLASNLGTNASDTRFLKHVLVSAVKIRDFARLAIWIVLWKVPSNCPFIRYFNSILANLLNIILWIYAISYPRTWQILEYFRFTSRLKMKNLFLLAKLWYW